MSGEGVRGSKVEAKPIRFKEASPGDGNPVLHMRNWLECVHKGERRTNCTPEHGHQHAVACIMAAHALHSGHRVVYDEKKRTIADG